MKKWLFSTVILLIFGTALWLAVRARSTGDLTLQSAPAPWPADRSWTWSFKMPPTPRGDRSGVSLRVRTKATTLPAGVTTAYPQSAAMTHDAAENEFGPGGMFDPFNAKQPLTSGTVTIKLVDLATIGAQPTTPGQNLRVLASVSSNGASLHLAGDQSILPAGTFSGTSYEHTGHWKNNEL